MDLSAQAGVDADAKLQSIRIAQSLAHDPVQAVRELYQGLAQADMAFVIFFCSNRYDHQVLAAQMQRQFSQVTVVGCTTAGEIGPCGYAEHSLVGASFSADACTVAVGLLSDLQQFDAMAGYDFTQNLLRRFEAKAPTADEHNSFGLLLIDGLSVREEPVTRVGYGPILPKNCGPSANWLSCSSSCANKQCAIL